jgi:hypothetical protein
MALSKVSVIFASILLLLVLATKTKDCKAFSAHFSATTPSRQDRSSLHAVITSSEDDTKQQLWTMEELEEQVSKVGVIISWSTFGPGYRAVARAKHNESLVIGYVEGFVRPAGEILHLDKMEVYKPMVKRARREAPSMDFGGVSFAIGLLLGYRCLLHGIEKGCKTAEFLAIDDEEFQHKRLVKYYKIVGFQVVKYVGENVQDIPDRLVWGGCGTLMREDTQALLRKFSGSLSLMKKRAKK